MKRCAILLSCGLTLAGCSGGDSTTFGFQNTNLSGTSYAGRAVMAKRSTTSTGTSLSSSAATLEFTPSSSSGSGADAYRFVTLTLDGESFVFTPETGNSATSVLGDDGIVFAPTFGGVPGLKDVLMGTLIAGNGFFGNDVGVFVLGNQTPAAALSSAAVFYSGRASLIDGANPFDISGGALNAVVDFGSASLASGSIAMETGSLAGTSMVMSPAALAGAGFETILGSTDVTITQSYLEGRFFGPDGGELAGTLYVATPANDYVGLFAATD